MKVSVFGLGYVGTVSAACLADGGHEVIGVDVNPWKLEMIGSGRSPVIEPGLDELVAKAVAAGRLSVTNDGPAAVRQTELSLVCVGTPSNANGSLMLDYLEKVCGEIGVGLADCAHYHVVAIRSTVLAGTVRERLLTILEERSGRKAGVDFGVCMNPEFLRESCAIEDYYEPSFIVIGELDERSGDMVEKMYQTLDAPVIRTTIETAEMVKYVCNAYHALKISFANEIGNLCKARGVDGREVMEIFCQDHRLNISAAYLKPGFAFGGSCLPKDLRAILHMGKTEDVETPLLKSVLVSNEQQVARGIEMVERSGRKKVGVLGLSFKAGTDDVRESPMVPLIETLLGRGYDVKLHDENVDPARLVGANRTFVERELPHIASLMSKTVAGVLDHADVVVIANGSAAYRSVPSHLRDGQSVIDLVGMKNGNGENGHATTRGSYEGICW